MEKQAAQQWPLILLLVGLYLLVHPYQGLVHDSRIYTLQALNFLNPGVYGNDVYLKFGSQDSYTIFSPLYSGLIAILGAEHAASFVTLISNAAVLVSAWWLARILMPPRLAWFAVGVLIIIPDYYGPDEFFSLLEGFATPRQLAEAFVLAALAAWLREKRLVCAGFLIAGFVIHPIMTFSGALLLVTTWGLDNWRKLWPFLAVTAAFGIAAVAGWLPISRWQFDPAWWAMVGRENLLLIGEWTISDWSRIATTQATLIFACLVLPDPTQRLARALLITSCVALLLSWAGGDLLKIVIVIQGQAWRAMWLATAFAALLLPYIAWVCVKSSTLHRTALLLLLAAWVIGHQGLALTFTIPAVIIAAYARLPMQERHARVAMLAAVTVLTVSILCSIALTASEHIALTPTAESPAWLQRLRWASTDRLLPGAALLSVWYLTFRMRSTRSRTALTLAVALPVAAASPAELESWITRTYPTEVHQAFAIWRDLIPPGSDVLWATSVVRGSDPSSVWLLLNRPSYYSSVQVNSALFSRAAAIELQRRHASIPAALPTEQSLRVLYDDASVPNCEDVPTPYIVTNAEIEGAILILAPRDVASPFDRMTLQVCP